MEIINTFYVSLHNDKNNMKGRHGLHGCTYMYVHLMQGNSSFFGKISPSDGPATHVHSDIRVVHSKHFWAIFSSFFISFSMSFFKNEVQNEARMSWKMLIVTFHFHLPFLSFFQSPLWCHIHHYHPRHHHCHHHNSVTTCPHYSTAYKSCEWPQMTHFIWTLYTMQAQMMATHHLGLFLLFVR